MNYIAVLQQEQTTETYDNIPVVIEKEVFTKTKDWVEVQLENEIVGTFTKSQLVQNNTRIDEQIARMETEKADNQLKIDEIDSKFAK